MIEQVIDKIRKNDVVREALSFRWLNLRSKKLEPYYRAGCTFLVRKIFFHPTYINFDKIPKEGGALIIANHVSYLDGVIISCGLDRPVRYVIDEYIFKTPGVHYFLDIARAIPVRAKKESVERMLEQVAEGLAAGDLVCIFPEGQLTYTGNLGRFKPGVEWILKRAPVPVYPVALKGLWGSVLSRKYLKSPLRWLRINWGAEITAICGDPIAPEQVNVNILQRAVMRLKNSL